MKLLLLLSLSACASYTDPEQEKHTYYSCEKKQTIVVKHSDDYQRIYLKLADEQILMHHFVTENGEGYRTENYLWLVKGKRAKLMTLKADGTEAEVLGDCKAQRMDLDF